MGKQRSVFDSIEEKNNNQKNWFTPDTVADVRESQYNKFLNNNSTNVEDERSKMQGVIPALANTIAVNAGRLGLRTIDTIGFVPVVAGNLLYNTFSPNEKLEFSDIYDNPLSVFLRESEESLAKALPVYKSAGQQEDSLSGLGKSIASVNGFDSLLNGLTYIASMGLGKSIIKGGFKASAKYLPKFFDAINKGDDLTSFATNTFKDLTEESGILGKLGDASSIAKDNSAIKEAGWNVWGGMIESASEASETKKNLIQNLTDLKKKELGRDLTKEEVDIVNDKAERGGSLNFLANILMTTGANSLLWNKLYNNKWVDDVKKIKGIDLKDGVASLTEDKLKKYSKYVNKNILEGVAVEGGQEGGQFFTNDFITSVLSKPDLKNEEDGVDYVKEFGKSLGKTFTSKDGLESMIIGSILGGGGGYLMNKTRDSSGEDLEKQTIIDTINNGNQNTGTLYQSDAKVKELQNIGNTALLNNDRFTFENIKKAKVFEIANSYDKIGKSEEFLNKLDLDKKLLKQNPDLFKQQYGIENLDEELMSKKIDSLKTDVKSILDVKNKLVDSYGVKLNEDKSGKILEALTLYKVYEKDFAKRETDLISELKKDSNGSLDYLDFISKKQDSKQVIEDEIKNLDSQIEEAKENKDIERINEISKQYLDLNKKLSETITDTDYFQLFKKELNLVDENEKEKDKHLKTNEFLQKINDLGSIQKAKEDVITSYNMLIGDSKSRDKFLKSLEEKQYGSEYENNFTFEFEDSKKVSSGENIKEKNLIKEGDVVKLRRSVVSEKNGEKEYKTIEDFVEIVKTEMESSTDKDGKIVNKGFITVKNEDGTIDKISSSLLNGNNKYKPVFLKFSKAYEGYEVSMPENFDEEKLKEEVKKEVEIQYSDKSDVYKQKVVSTKLKKEKEKILKENGIANTNLFSVNYELPEWKLYNKAKGKIVNYIDIDGSEHEGHLVFLNGNLLVRSIATKDIKRGDFTFKKGEWSNTIVKLNTKKTSLKIYNQEESIIKTIGQSLIAKGNRLEKAIKKNEKYENLISVLENRIEEDGIKDDLKNLIISRVSRLKINQEKNASKLAYYNRIGKELNVPILKSIYDEVESDSYKERLGELEKIYKEFVSLNFEQNQKLIDNVNEKTKELGIKIQEDLMSLDSFDEDGNLKDNLIINSDYLDLISDKESDVEKLGDFFKNLNYSIDPLGELISLLPNDYKANFDILNKEVDDYFNDLKLEKNKLDSAFSDDLKSLLNGNLPLLKSVIENEIESIKGFFKRASYRYYDYVYNESYEKSNEPVVYLKQDSVLFRTSGNSQTTSNLYEERFYRNIQSITSEDHVLVPLLKNEYKQFGYGNSTGYYLKVVDKKSGKILGITTVREPNIKSSMLKTLQGQLRLSFGIYEKEFFGDVSLLNYVIKKDSDTDDIKSLYDSSNKNILDVYKYVYNNTNDEKLKLAIDDIFNNHIIPSIKIRMDIDLANKIDSKISYEIDGINWGIPIKSEDEVELKDFLPEEKYNAFLNGKKGNFIVPLDDKEGERTKVGTYQLNSGFVYFKDSDGSVVPVKTKLVNKEIVKTLLNGLLYINKKEKKDRFSAIKELSVSDKNSETPVNLLGRYLNFDKRNSNTKLLYSINENDEVSLVYGFENGLNKEVFIDDIFTDGKLNDKGVELLDYLSTVLRHNVDEELIKDNVKNEKFTDYKIDEDGNLISEKNTYTYSNYLTKEYIYVNLKSSYGNKFDNGYVVIKNKNEKEKVNSVKKEEKKTETNGEKNNNTQEQNVNTESEGQTNSDTGTEFFTGQFTEKTKNKNNEISDLLSSQGFKDLVGDKYEKIVDEYKDYSDTIMSFVSLVSEIEDIDFNLLMNLTNKNSTKNESPPTDKEDFGSFQFDPESMFFLYDENLDESFMSKEDYIKAKDLFQNKYKLPYEVVNGLVKNKAWGMVSLSGKVLLSDEALVGTQYHEEFHVVSQFAFTPKQRLKIYDEWRKQNPKENLSNDTIEEKLAEEFRYYRLTGRFKNEKEKNSNFLKSIFDYIINFIKTITGLNKYETETLFKNIKKGKFYNKINVNNSNGSFYSEVKRTNAETKIINDGIYNEYIKLLFGDRKNELIDFNDVNFIGTLSIPERFLLEKEGLQKFKTFNGYSSSNAILHILNNDTLSNEFFNEYEIKAKDGRMLKAINLMAGNSVARYENINGRNVYNDKDGGRSFYNELLYKIKSELKINIDEYEEESVSKDGVKENSNEINHYEVLQTKIKLILSHLINKGTGERGSKYKNVTEYLSAIFNEMSSIDTSDANLFFRELEYKFPVLSKYIGVGSKIDENKINFQIFQNKLYKYLAKQKLNYQVLKIDEKTKSINFIDSLQEKRLDVVIDRYISYFNNADYDNVSIKIDGVRLLNKEVNKKINEDLLNKLASYLGIKSIPSAYNVLGSNINKINEALKEKDIKKLKGYLKYVAIEELKYSEDGNSTLSLPTANGKSTYALQEHSSLSKKYEEYKHETYKKENGILQLFDSEEDSLVLFSGTQSKKEKYKNDEYENFVDYEDEINSVKKFRSTYESDSERSVDMNEFDMIGFAYQGVKKAIKEKSGFFPFLFSGDKSSFWGFKLKLYDIPVEILNGITTVSGGTIDYFKNLLKDEIESYNSYLLAKNNLSYVERQGDELPFYSFLKDYDLKLYESLLNIENEEEKRVLIDKAFEILQQKMLNDSLGLEKYFKDNNLIADYKVENTRLDYLQHTYINTIALLEQSKITGDLTYYKDFTKRIPAMASGKESMNLSKESVEFFNKFIKDKSEKDIFPSEMRSLIVDDVYISQEVLDSSEYEDNNVTDAQGYISLHAFKFMMFTSGRYNNDWKLLFEKYEKEDDKLIKEVNEKLNSIKPQFYGFHKDTNIPLFYKLSVVPLYSDYTKGKNLENLQSIMKESNNHFIIVDSGNKVGRKVLNGNFFDIGDEFKTGNPITLSLYDLEKNYNPSFVIKNNGVLIYKPISETKHKLNDIVNELTQISDWKYNGIQVETNNQHNKVKLGTQQRVTSLADLDVSDVTPEVVKEFIQDYNEELSPKQNIVKAFDDLMEEKYQEDKAKLLKKLDLTEENDGYKLGNTTIEKFKELLIDTSINSGVPKEFINHLRNLKSYDLINNKQKLASIINKILDLSAQKMNGDSKVQVSSAFFESKNGNIQRDNDLKGYESDGKFYLEVYLPLENARFFQDYLQEKTDEKGILRFKDNVSREVMASVGFRTPTQYLNSIDNIVIKGFLPSSAGNQVVVPSIITTKSGSDFDIDKLNLYFPKFKKRETTLDDVLPLIQDDLKKFIVNLKKINKKNTDTELIPDIELEKIYSENDEYIKQLYEKNKFNELDKKNNDLTDVEKNIILEIDKLREKIVKYEYDNDSVDNKIIKFYNDVLGLRKSLVVKPNSVGVIKKTIKNLIEPALRIINQDGKKSNAFNLQWLLKRRVSFLNAKSTLGVQALAQKNHILSQIYDIQINDRKLIKEGKKKSITIKSLSELLSAFKNRVEKNSDGYYSLNRVYDINGGIISHTLSETIDATVDAAKDDYISSANFTKKTAGVFNLLVRLGNDPVVVTMLISQPSIVNHIRNLNLKSSAFSNFQYFAPPIYSTSYGGLNLDSSKLLSELENKGLGKNTDTPFQSQILNLFLELDEHAKMLGDFTKLTTFDTKGMGTSIEENQAILRFYEKNKRKIFDYFVNSKNIFESENGSKTFIENFKESSQKGGNFTNEFFQLEKYFPTYFKDYLDSIYDDLYSSNFDKAKSAYKLKELFLTYMIQKQLYINGYSADSILSDLGEKLYSLKNSKSSEFKGDLNKLYEFRDNYLVKKLSVAITKGGNDKKKFRLNTILLFNSAKLEKEEANDLSNAWLDLLSISPKIAKELAVYAIYQSGTLNSPVSFYNLIPYEIKRELGINDLESLLQNGLLENNTELLNATTIAIDNEGKNNIFDRFLLDSVSVVDDDLILRKTLSNFGYSQKDIDNIMKTVRNGNLQEILLNNKKEC